MICRYCGQEFQSSVNYCCNKCLDEFKLEFDRLSSEGLEIVHCKYCGKPIRRKGTTCYCKGIDNDNMHYRECVSCGRGFKVNVKESDKKTCSKECRNISFASHGPNHFVPKNLKTCKECGKTFRPNSSRQIYCKGPHYRCCTICGKKYEIDLSKCFGDTCSEECRLKLIERTSLERYGETNIFKTDKFKSDMKKRNQELYGVDHYFQTQQFKDSVIATCLNRYGATSFSGHPDVIEKRKHTNQKRYGGNAPTCNKDVLNKRIATNLDRYGYEHPNSRPEAIEHMKHIQIMRHANSITDPVKREEYILFKENPRLYLSQIGDKITIRDLCNKTGYTDVTSVQTIIQDYSLQEFIDYAESEMEHEVRLYIENEFNIQLSRRIRSVIHPYEIDLYSDQYKIGIECNPTVTHNSTKTLNMVIDERDTRSLDPGYHKMKSDISESNGIFLFHIFGYEWSNKKDIIQSMLRNLFNCNVHKYYARKLSIKEVSYLDSELFLNCNHRQGNASSSVRIGLYDGDNLVSLMTFGKTRSTIGSKSSDTQHSWELIRFCNKMNTSVVGGASKLFNYFIRNYDFDKIVSFSDRAHTRGNLYEILGFNIISCSEPGYTWVNLNTDVFFTRVACQKRNLRKLFNDETIDIENKTEQQIMTEHGFVQVYDSGTIRWEYTK